MPTDEQLEDLVDRWHEAMAAGTALTPTEFCRDTPELLSDFQRLLTLLGRFEVLRSEEGVATLQHPPAATTTLPDPPATYAPASPGTTSPLPGIGAEFDGYRILAEMGRGGMGCVFRATNIVLKRDEALKMMLPKVAVNPQARERFLREARAMAAVRHDNVMEIYHVRETEGIPYLAMPLLAGETLEQRLKREHTLPAEEVVRIGVQMAEGLAAAHGQGMIHRDIKPSNVWLEAGIHRVKLLDFGLAREEGTASNLTGEGTILGTPAYMSPEQVEGTTLDARSDLFSVGSVLYECATGHRAFQGTTMTAILSAVVQKDPPAAHTLNAVIPALLSDLVRALLHKNPSQRPGSAVDLARRLRMVEAGSPAVDDLGLTKDYTNSRGRRRWPWIVAVSCLLVCGLLGGSAIHWNWFPSRSVEDKATGQPVKDPADLKPPVAIAASPSQPQVVEPLRVLKIDVHHYDAAKDEWPGMIGEKSFYATLGDQVTIRAQLSRPAYAFLIAFNPNGTSELCFPDPSDPKSLDQPPPMMDHLTYPFLDRNKRFGLSEGDGDGLMVFAVVASEQPLPSYREWSAQHRPAWQHAEGKVGEVWRYDGELFDTLTTKGPQRATGEEAKGRSAAVFRLTESLRRGTPNSVVGCIGFVVRKP